MRFWAVLVALAICARVQAQWPGKQGTVYFANDKYSFVAGTVDKNGAAYGSYDPGSTHPSNFGVLKIETNAEFPDTAQMYAAGYLEGALTADDIYDMYVNMLSTWPELNPAPPANLTRFLDAQDKWVRASVASHPTEPYWQQLGHVLAQYDGLIAGYAAYPSKGRQLSRFSFFMLNGCGDLFDLIPATSPAFRKDPARMTPGEFQEFFSTNGHCSALVKLNGDFSQLWMAHSSWFRYQAMIRIMKHYHFQTRVSVAKKVSFSSYPAFLESLDDFYLMDTGLVMLQTTNSIFDNSLYQYVVPESVFAWQRVRVGCALAQSGEEWTEIVGRYNSGTYNNQYMVIDLKKFTPQQPLLPGTLWVSEQIPGTYAASDQTAQLERGYWPSYNVAFHPNIYNISGYPQMVQRYGTDYSYDLCARANIFRRDQGTVVDMDSFMALMRDNDYTKDPYSKGSPYNAICSRGDLSGSPRPGGCYDTKVTDYSHALKLQSWAINGPTTSHNLPPFSWTHFPNATRVGMPDVFDFEFEFQDPQWN